MSRKWTRFVSRKWTRFVFILDSGVQDFGIPFSKVDNICVHFLDTNCVHFLDTNCVHFLVIGLEKGTEGKGKEGTGREGKGKE